MFSNVSNPDAIEKTGGRGVHTPMVGVSEDTGIGTLRLGEAYLCQDSTTLPLGGMSHVTGLVAAGLRTPEITPIG